VKYITPAKHNLSEKPVRWQWARLKRRRFLVGGQTRDQPSVAGVDSDVRTSITTVMRVIKVIIVFGVFFFLWLLSTTIYVVELAPRKYGAGGYGFQESSRAAASSGLFHRSMVDKVVVVFEVI